MYYLVRSLELDKSAGDYISLAKAEAAARAAANRWGENAFIYKSQWDENIPHDQIEGWFCPSEPRAELVASFG